LTSEKTRRTVFFVRAVVVAIIVLIGLLTVTAITAVKSIETREDLNEAQRFDPCVSLSEAVAHTADKKRITELTIECQTFLNGLSTLVTVKLSCAIIHTGGYLCPAPRRAANAADRKPQTVLGPTLDGVSMPNPTGDQGAPSGGSGKNQDHGTHEHSPHHSPPPRRTRACPAKQYRRRGRDRRNTIPA
jgi:hypothetical protein